MCVSHLLLVLLIQLEGGEMLSLVPEASLGFSELGYSLEGLAITVSFTDKGNESVVNLLSVACVRQCINGKLQPWWDVYG